jgi:hypothetical protein
MPPATSSQETGEGKVVAVPQPEVKAAEPPENPPAPPPKKTAAAVPEPETPEKDKGRFKLRPRGKPK